MKSIRLNGKPHETAAMDVAGLLSELGFAAGTVLVELDGVALRPEEWINVLKEGAQVELMKIAAGG